MQTTINPEIIFDASQLTKRVIAVWSSIDQDTRNQLTEALADVGITPLGKSWVYQLNGRTIAIN